MLLYHKSTPAFLCCDYAQEIRLGQEDYEICTEMVRETLKYKLG